MRVGIAIAEALGMLTHLAMVLVVTCSVLVHTASEAEACSPRWDYVDGEVRVRAFDAALAPAAPLIVEAEVLHSDFDEPGCAESSCGDFSGLSLLVDNVADGSILRITHADGTKDYATLGYQNAEGLRDIYLFGYSDKATSFQVSIATIDAEGYPSEEVVVNVYVEPEAEGCHASGRSGSGLTMALMFAAALMLGRRRRQA